ncbi:MAG: DUF4421 family protein [Flavobacteriaceae bacterium]|nr:DUF4421 family protein [Flavobacteriaceae bacterium]MCB0475591.1 DUF4421 family protein [Flavobacteriaceae bacterium]
MAYKQLILLFLFPFVAIGQADKTLDTTYIRSFPDKITTRVGFANSTYAFNLSEKQTNASYEVKPNQETSVTLSALFRSIELDLGFTPRFFPGNNDDKEKGETKKLTFNFRMFLGQWMQTIDYNAAKGFYLQDNKDQRVLALLPDLRITTIGGTTSYIFNRNFSFRAIGFQNEWQKKSAGSFIPRLSYFCHFFNSEEFDFNNDYSLDIAIGPGYYYNFVIDKNFLLSAGSTLGIGLNKTQDKSESITSVLYQGILRTSIGYNSENFFAGFSGNVNTFKYDQKSDFNYNDSIYFFEFYLGYRFKAPEKWIEKVDAFNKKLGL